MVDKHNDNSSKGTMNNEATHDIQKESLEEHHFTNAFNFDAILMENRSILAITDSCSNDFAKALSDFMSRKFEVVFSTIKCVDIKDILLQSELLIYSNFSISQYPHHGLILFPGALLNLFVSFLFGSEKPETESVDIRFGKCALKIAKKIAEIFLVAFQNAIEVFTEFESVLLECNDKPKSVIRSRYMSEKACQLDFELSGMASVFTLSVIVPELLIESITHQSYEQQVESKKVSNTDDVTQKKDNLRDDLIDTSIDLIAVLPAIKLKLSDALNLKKGDIIPIGNPELVELTVGNRATYKAVVGQANEHRVVKITDSLI